jgi:hypothetical protein
MIEFQNSTNGKKFLSVFASNQDYKIQHNIQHDTSNVSTLISVENQKLGDGIWFKINFFSIVLSLETLQKTLPLKFKLE